MTPGSARVTVVIPCYNYGRFLGEAVASALGQTHSPLEIIIVDDGSTDETAAVAATFDGIVRYVYQPNQGIGATRNTGAAAASGDFVVYLDADDRLDPRYLAATLECLSASPEAAYAYTQMRSFGREAGVTTSPPFDLDRLLRGNFINASALLPVSLVRRFGYEPTLEAWQDWDFYLTLAEHGHFGVLVDEPLLYYRKHIDRVSITDGVIAGGLRRRRELRRRIRARHPALFARHGWRRLFPPSLLRW